MKGAFVDHVRRLSPNEYDLLVQDLIAVQDWRERGALPAIVRKFKPGETGVKHTGTDPAFRKALAAVESIHASIAPPPAAPAPAGNRRQTFNEVTAGIMAKAMAAFEGGRMSALDVARLEARIHRM